MLRHFCFSLLLGGSLSLVASAEDRYIDDTQFMPLRSGSSLENRIVHQGVPGGTPVAVVQDDAALGWTLVRTRDGTEGWLPSRHLKREPGARYQVLVALRALGQPDDGSVTLAVAIEQLRKDIESAHAERDSLQEQLVELRQLSGNATQLDKNNRKLGEDLQMLKSQIGVLEADNQRLRDTAWQKWFINGVWATGVGGVLTLVLARLVSSRKRRSEWV